MKRLSIFLLVMLCTLTACGKTPTVPIIPEPTPDQERPANERGLSLQLEANNFKNSPTHIDTILRNDSERNYRFGEFYHIEVLVDHDWHMMTYSDLVFTSNPKFKDTGQILKAGEEVRQSFSVEQLGVTLLPGEYRLVKTFLVQGEPFHEISVAATFTVKD